MSLPSHSSLHCRCSHILATQLFQLRWLWPHVARVRASCPAAPLQHMRLYRPQVTRTSAQRRSRANCTRLTFTSLGSVHSCPNTPCFRCRLPGHRAKDCTSRRWPKDMCWRCLRTDRYTRVSQYVGSLFPPRHTHQSLAVAMQSRSSFVARAVVESNGLPELRKIRSCACDFR